MSIGSGNYAELSMSKMPFVVSFMSMLASCGMLYFFLTHVALYSDRMFFYYASVVFFGLSMLVSTLVFAGQLGFYAFERILRHTRIGFLR